MSSVRKRPSYRSSCNVQQVGGWNATRQTDNNLTGNETITCPQRTKHNASNSRQVLSANELLIYSSFEHTRIKIGIKIPVVIRAEVQLWFAVFRCCFLLLVSRVQGRRRIQCQLNCNARKRRSMWLCMNGRTSLRKEFLETLILTRKFRNIPVFWNWNWFMNVATVPRCEWSKPSAHCHITFI